MVDYERTPVRQAALDDLNEQKVKDFLVSRGIPVIIKNGSDAIRAAFARWRWRESNPRPKHSHRDIYRFSRTFGGSLGGLRATGFLCPTSR